jgi:hypothetical protein
MLKMNKLGTENKSFLVRKENRYTSAKYNPKERYKILKETKLYDIRIHIN